MKKFQYAYLSSRYIYFFALSSNFTIMSSQDQWVSKLSLICMVLNRSLNDSRASTISLFNRGISRRFTSSTSGCLNVWGFKTSWYFPSFFFCRKLCNFVLWAQSPYVFSQRSAVLLGKLCSCLSPILVNLPWWKQFRIVTLHSGCNSTLQYNCNTSGLFRLDYVGKLSFGLFVSNNQCIVSII